MNRATRGDGLYIVDSQRTERIQAEDPPAIWPNRPGPDLLTLGIIACACTIVGYCLMNVLIAAYEFLH